MKGLLLALAISGQPSSEKEMKEADLNMWGPCLHISGVFHDICLKRRGCPEYNKCKWNPDPDCKPPPLTHNPSKCAWACRNITVSLLTTCTVKGGDKVE